MAEKCREPANQMLTTLIQQVAESTSLGGKNTPNWLLSMSIDSDHTTVSIRDVKLGQIMLLKLIKLFYFCQVLNVLHAPNIYWISGMNRNPLSFVNFFVTAILSFQSKELCQIRGFSPASSGGMIARGFSPLCQALFFTYFRGMHICFLRKRTSRGFGSL